MQLLKTFEEYTAHLFYLFSRAARLKPFEVRSFGEIINTLVGNDEIDTENCEDL